MPVDAPPYRAESALAPPRPALTEWALIVAVSLCSMLAPLNSTMIVVALPRIVRDFGATLGAGGWLITLYLIAMASVQPLAGKLGDRWGRRPLILTSLLAFSAVSIAAALAPSLPALIVFRVLQALSAGLALPNGMALVREAVPAERRGSRFGIVASLVSVAAALGPPLGGVLVQFGGWRAIFAANILLVGPALAIGWQVFPRAAVRRQHPRFDLLGAILLSSALVGLAALLIRLPNQSAVVSALWGTGVAALGLLFARHELAAADPVLQLRLFRNATFAGGNAAIALSNLAMYTTLIAVPLLAARRTHLTPVQVGLLLAAMSATNVLAAPLGGRLADRLGRRLPTVIGLVLAVPGLVALVVAGAHITIPVLAGGLAVAGFGFGMGWASLQTAVIESVQPRLAGSASGIFSTARYLGSIVGTSVLAALVAGSGEHDFTPIFAMAAVAAAAAAVSSLWLASRPSTD
ncbi:MAG TPA: MFS transporter [Chloroflexota bacterium]|nr:MFS transporter [Chloroflexota bacterium]